MNKQRPLFSRPWVWHSLCCLIALLSCVPILWPQVYLPDAYEQAAISYAGALLLGSFLLSLTLIIVSSLIMLLRMRNLRALGQIIAWGAQWVAAAVIFGLLAYIANIPQPDAAEAFSLPSQKKDQLHQPNDQLTGPESLVISISPERFSPDVVQKIPHLSLLETKHAQLLAEYIDKSPRWALYTTDDTFYTKPGHMVMIPPTTGGTPGLVHVAFRRLVEGEPLPVGYTIVQPGDPMPATPEGSEQVPDLALDLGRNHYLLLAWRGTSHTETAHRALNAAIASVDAMLEPLANAPEPATVQKMIIGKRNIYASTPEILLSQPPAQYGAYQAEIYVNPGEPGTLILRIAEMETDTTLRLFSCPALFSTNPNELFRHDIPGSIPEQMLASSFGHIPGLLPEKSPVFAICRGEPHQFFGVMFEVIFNPATTSKSRRARVLLRRHYRVQASEGILPPEAPPTPAHEPEQKETVAEQPS